MRLLFVQSIAWLDRTSGRNGVVRFLLCLLAVTNLFNFSLFFHELTVSAQTRVTETSADGLMHVSLTLEAQEIDVAFSPFLEDSGAANQAFLEGIIGSRIRVGSLDAHRALRLGSLAPNVTVSNSTESENDNVPGAQESKSTLWLSRNTQGWQLEIHSGEDPEVNDIYIVPLSHRERALSFSTFSASIHSTDDEMGRLMFRWGRHAWSADFRFDELPIPPRRPRVSGRGTAREADDDGTRIARRSMLNERNETRVVWPGGANVSVLFWKNLDVDEADYSRVETIRNDAVIEMIHAPVLRFKSDVPLRFGGEEVPTGNLAVGFAGAYGIWLKKTADGWRLVFNNEPDSWGTQYDQNFDAVEVAVDYARGEGAFRPLGVTLVPTGSHQGRLMVHWGPHEWAADFVIPVP